MSYGGQLAELEKDLSTARSGRTIRPFRASGRLGEGFWQPPSVYDPSLSSSFALRVYHGRTAYGARMKTSHG